MSTVFVKLWLGLICFLILYVFQILHNKLQSEKNIVVLKLFASILENQIMENFNSIDAILHINFSFNLKSNMEKTNCQNSHWQGWYLIENIEKGNT